MLKHFKFTWRSHIALDKAIAKTIKDYVKTANEIYIKHFTEFSKACARNFDKKCLTHGFTLKCEWRNCPYGKNAIKNIS